MARGPTPSQRRQIEALIGTHEPLIRAAFLAMADQAKTALDMAALIEAVEYFNRTRDASRAIEMLRINQQLLFPLTEAIRAAVIAGGLSVIAPKAIAGAFSFNGRHPRAEQIIAQIGADLVTEIGSPGPEAIRAILLTGQEQNTGAAKVARQLGGTINKLTGRREGGILGLDGPRAERARRVREILSDPAQIADYFTGGKARFTSTDRRFDAMVRRAIAEGKALPAADVEKVARAHEARLLKARADTIARAEAFTAQAQGRNEAYAQILDGGKVKSISKKWQHATAKNPRHDHQALDGVTVGFSEAFVMADGTRMQHAHDPAGGPEHNIGCRCSVVYVPKFKKG